MSTIKNRILAQLKERPSTARELGDCMHLNPQVTGVRLSQLKKAGYLVCTRDESLPWSPARYSVAIDAPVPSHARDRRLALVLDSLRDKPACVSELSDRLHIKRGRIYEDINALLNARQIRRVAMTVENKRPASVWGLV